VKLRNVALRIPAIRRLHEGRNALLAQRDSLLRQLSATDGSTGPAPSASSPFFHYNASFDAEEVIRRHAAPNLSPDPDYLTNYLGVIINPKFLPAILADHRGVLEGVPIPANWHADIAEWAAALRAVEKAQQTFTMIELGCGWGCWMNNTGVAARRLQKDVQLIGVEGDQGHIEFAREATAANGFQPAQVELHHGIASAIPGTALFPRQAQAGIEWGLEPIFGASDAERQTALRTGSHEVLTMITLAELAGPRQRIDLLHIDIQGGEADLIAGSMPILQEKVAYLVIGTHSRAIEGRLFDILLGAGWQLEIERPALLSLGSNGPIVTVDGVQGWRNAGILPQ
jgi:FkbM family methyltransferase